MGQTLESTYHEAHEEKKAEEDPPRMSSPTRVKIEMNKAKAFQEKFGMNDEESFSTK